MTSPNRILLVDDEPRLLAALRRRLSMSFDIVTANGGPEAIELLKLDRAIAVIVADMKMPEMNGIELLKIVKRDRPDVRRIMLTGNADQETAIAAINEGEVMRFLQKPCDAEELKAVLRQALAEYEFQNGPSLGETVAPAPVQKIAAPPAGPESPSPADAKARVMSLMAGELRAPIAEIAGLARRFEEAFAAASGVVDAEADLQALARLRDSGEQAAALARRMIAFSKLQGVAGAGADLIAILNEEVKTARAGAARKSVTISVDSLRKRVDIEAGAEDVRAAVRELLANAVKFNPQGGHVSVLVKCDAERAALRISDSGCGLPEGAHERLEQLAAGGAAAAEPGGAFGEGIGLALVAALAASNGADFRIATQAEGGTAATLVFRRAARAEEERPQAAG